MDSLPRRWTPGLAIIAAVVLLPLAGAWFADKDLRAFFLFPPPLEILSGYPQWSWVACGLVVLPFAYVAWGWFGRRETDNKLLPAASRASDHPSAGAAPRSLPWWGWAAILWTVGWWILAWTRFPWFAAGQLYTFFPLWLGFIFAVNAFTFRASGQCGLVHAPRPWLMLFLASAVFWWAFEWLNRFVQNWHYPVVEQFGPVSYALHATLCFSTVLPAVAAVREWLGTRSNWHARLSNGPRWRWFARPGTGLLFIVAGLTALLCTGYAPQEFYAALWGAPLALAVGQGVLARRAGVWDEMAVGDWRNVGSWAVAALICGLFWEMWNWLSAAKWIYTVPYVDRWHVFEMPLLGYLGYLPFGLECLIVTQAVLGAQAPDLSRRRDDPRVPAKLNELSNHPSRQT